MAPTVPPRPTLPPQRKPTKFTVSVPQDHQVQAVVRDAAQALAVPFAGLALEVLAWNRWGRKAFGVQRKLRYREAFALKMAVGAIAAEVDRSIRSNRADADARRAIVHGLTSRMSPNRGGSR